MPATTITSREFNQDVGRAKRAAAKGPVIITDRGRPAHVLLSIDDYCRITGRKESIVELLGDPKAAAIKFNPPRVTRLHRPADFS
jgi:prevent-host-death family protein